MWQADLRSYAQAMTRFAFSSMRARLLIAVGYEQTNVRRQLFVGQVKFFSHPIGLQRRDEKIALRERALPQRHPTAAQAAGTVVKHSTVGFPFIQVFHRIKLKYAISCLARNLAVKPLLRLDQVPY